MNRKYTASDYLKKIEMINKYIPGCGITSDIMVGFPGETDEDFNDTLKPGKKSGVFGLLYIYLLQEVGHGRRRYGKPNRRRGCKAAYNRAYRRTEPDYKKI